MDCSMEFHLSNIGLDRLSYGIPPVPHWTTEVVKISSHSGATLQWRLIIKSSQLRQKHGNELSFRDYQSDFTATFKIYHCVVRPHQLVLGLPSMHMQLFLCPGAKCTVFPLDLDFFSDFSLLQIAFPKNLVAL